MPVLPSTGQPTRRNSPLSSRDPNVLVRSRHSAEPCFYMPLFIWACCCRRKFDNKSITIRARHHRRASRRVEDAPSPPAAWWRVTRPDGGRGPRWLQEAMSGRGTVLLHRYGNGCGLHLRVLLEGEFGNIGAPLHIQQRGILLALRRGGVGVPGDRLDILIIARHKQHT